MIKLEWIGHLPGGNLSGGIALADELGWFLKIQDLGSKFIVRAGDQKIFETDSKDSLDAFLYGLSLSYAVLPESITESIRKFVKATRGDG